VRSYLTLLSVCHAIQILIFFLMTFVASQAAVTLGFVLKGYLQSIVLFSSVV